MNLFTSGRIQQLMAFIATYAKILILAAALTLGACTGSSESASQREKAANSPAGKVGQVAYKVTKATGKIVKAAGKELGKAAHQAREGWKESAREDKAKKKQ
jgi:hypothetical protein